MRPRVHAIIALTVLVGWGCTAPPATQEPEPRPSACADSLYIELGREHPDSLSERAWERLQQLEEACRDEQSRSSDTDGVVGPGAEHHRDVWIWMPAMMVTGALMWLMMGGGI